MIRFAICDDDSYFVINLIAMIKDFVKTIDIDYCIDTYSNGASLLDIYGNSNREYHLYHDILFLDIEMTPPNGKEVARIIREKYPFAIRSLVFISVNFGYHNDLYDYFPSAFLIKPFSQKELSKVLTKIISNAPKNEGTFTFKKDSELYVIPNKEILYFENLGRQVTVYTKGKRKVEYNGLFRDVESQLAGEDFYKCHQQFIVNLHEVKRILRNDALMSNNDIVNISRRIKSDFTKAVSNRYGRHLWP